MNVISFPRCRFLFATVTGLVLSATARPSLAAEEYGNSLDWAPADASLYSASFHLKDQLDALLESNAWKAFKEMPSVEQVWGMAEAQINNPAGPAAVFWQIMELPENKQLVKLLGEMFSEEIVFYAGADFSKTLELLATVNGSRFAPMLQAIQQSGDDSDESEAPKNAQIEAMLSAIEEDPSLLDMPEMVIAFRIEDKEAAKTQLARLEVLANLALKQSPLDAKLEREEIGDSEYLVLKLDGSMIPWDQVEGQAEDNEHFEKMKEILTEKELVIAIGTWRDYVVMSLGKSSEHLETLGKGPFLVSQKEFASLKPHLEDNKVAAVQYMSRELMETQQISREDIEGAAELLLSSLEEAEDVPAKLTKQLEKDFDELAEDLEPYLPKLGAAVSCTLFADSGFESFTYNWSKQRTLDASKELEILRHLGGSPIFALAARGADHPEDYDLLVKWLRKGLGYFEDFALEQMDDDEREHAEEALELAKPLLKRLNAATREHLIPALKDGQSALVLDADIKSKQWHEDMPESHTALPMAELAIVMGLSDAEEFKAAAREYKAVADDIVDIIREKDPEAIPEDYEIPEPEKRSTDGGTVYEWAFAEPLGFDEQITLCGGIGEHVIALSNSAEMVERALAEKPLKMGGSITEGDEPRAMVAGINFAELIGAILPWVEFGVRSGMAGEEAAEEDPEDDSEEVRSVLDQVRTGAKILQCFRGAWSETREEDGVWVTHTVSEFKDLDD